jgi:hypothetical protein
MTFRPKPDLANICGGWGADLRHVHRPDFNSTVLIVEKFGVEGKIADGLAGRA